jgi:putative hydrolase of the HAD superfamily
MLAAVVFDLDDTLVVEASTARASAVEVAGLVSGVDPGAFADVLLATAGRIWGSGPSGALCRELGFASWEGLWSDLQGNDRRVDDLRSWIPAYRRQVWETVLATFDVDGPSLGGGLSEAYVRAQRRGHGVIAGADDLVRSLAGTYRLGLLTNGPSDIQRLKLAGSGLAGCFDAVVISGEVGLGKPDPTVFADVLTRLGVEPEDAVMVGDSWERDVVGALGAGVAAVWVAGGRTRPEDVPSVTVIQQAGELAGVLGQRDDGVGPARPGS